MTDNPTNAISVRGATKVFGRVRAVDGIEFTVHPGEVVAFLGPERRRQDHHH